MVNNPTEIRERAWAAHGQGDLRQAESLYRQLLSQVGAVEDAINLGALLRGLGRLREASEHYHHWLRRIPFDLGFSLNAANCFRENEDYKAAFGLLEAALKELPNNCQLHVSMAETQLAMGNWSNCRQRLEAVLSKETELREGWITLGVCCARLGDLGAALAAFKRAQELDPADKRMSANCITILKDLGRYEEAETIWKGLDKKQRRDPNLRGAMAGMRMGQNQMMEAAELLADLAKEEPQQPVHWLNWAACLKGLKYTVAPYQILKQGVKLNPSNLDLQEALGQALAEMAKPEQAKRIWSLRKKEDEPLKDLHLFSHQFLGASYGLIPAEERAKMARNWENEKKRKGVGRLWPDLLLEPLEGRRLRVGYLSADFCNHPVARFMLPILHAHRREEIEVWALSCGPHDDFITNQIKIASEHWIELRFLNDLEAARLIADLRLDVLIDLGGFTGHSRLGVLTQRPAPVQLSYLGYPAPTYLETIDGWIGDEALFGGLDAYDKAAHPLHRLKGGYMAFDPGGELPMPERTDAHKFRFGSFNHARKLTHKTVELFCQVMAEAPEAELVLKSISFIEKAEQERIRQIFIKAGLAEERLVLIDWVEGGLNHLKLYSKIDVALDPIPYGGATTTCEALWMGVPVIALKGEGMVGRLSASVLTYGKQSQWLGSTEKEYVEIAVNLAKQGKRKKKQRIKLRRELEKSPLADGERLCRELEKYYRQSRINVRGL